MENELKHYRIVSERGETLLITRERFRNLLATLDALMQEHHDHPEKAGSSNK